MPKNFLKSKLGFTLIELLIVVAIISILIAVGSVSYTTVQKRGRDAQRKSDVRKIALALEDYYAENRSYPANIGGATDSLSWSGSLSDGSRVYLDSVPRDPLNNASYNYKYLPSPPSAVFNTSQGFTILATFEISPGGLCAFKETGPNKYCN